jgi:hypothetical protein
VSDGFLRNQIALEALIAFGLGVGVVILDALHAHQGWGSRRRFLTFANQVKLRLMIIIIVTVLVALTIAVLFRSATTGAYLIALVLAIVQTLCGLWYPHRRYHSAHASTHSWAVPQSRTAIR